MKEIRKKEVFEQKKKAIIKSALIQFMLTLGVFALLSITVFIYAIVSTTTIALFTLGFSIVAIPILFACTCVAIVLIGIFRAMKAYEQHQKANSNVIEETPKSMHN